MTFRKILFWCHLGVGCTAGLVILIMSVTGVMLTYERQIVSRIEHGEFAIAVQAGAALLPEEILAKLEKQGTRISPNATLVFRSRRDEPVELVTGREAAVYIDPYSGQVLGRPSQQARGFFRQVVVWHRWLGQANGSRVWPKIATGVSNLVFLGILVSGFYLWIPKKWTVQHLRPITWFRSASPGKRGISIGITFSKCGRWPLCF